MILITFFSEFLRLKEEIVINSQKKRQISSIKPSSSSLLPTSLFTLAGTNRNSSKLLFIFFVISSFVAAQAFNDEKGILKWNPYWFSNFRYSAPSSFYISPHRVGTPYKRVSGSTVSHAPSSSSTIYKWSPVYFSGGSTGVQQPSYYHDNGASLDQAGGYMYSHNRPLWSSLDYGGNRFLTRYYGGNSFIPAAIPRSSDGGKGRGASVIDLAGSNNDLSALLGEEIMNRGLGLENDRIDILDDEDGTTAGTEVQG